MTHCWKWHEKMRWHHYNVSDCWKKEDDICNIKETKRRGESEITSDWPLRGKTHHCSTKRCLSFMSSDHKRGMFPSRGAVIQGQPFSRNDYATIRSDLSANTNVIIKSISISEMHCTPSARSQSHTELWFVPQSNISDLSCMKEHVQLAR